MKRVVVTGMGAVTPIGNSVEEFWDNIKKNTVGIGEITKFDVSDYKCKLAAEVRTLIQSSIWIQRRQDVWSHFVSMP